MVGRSNKTQLVGIGLRAMTLALLLGAEHLFAAGDELRRPAFLMKSPVEEESLKDRSETVSLAVSCPDGHHILPLALPATYSERELRGIDGKPRNLLGIAPGADGSIWVAAWNPGQLLRLKPDGAVESLELGRPGAFPVRIAAGIGGEVWYTDLTGFVGRIAPDGFVTEFALAPGSQPLGITSGWRGEAYFTEYGANRIGKLDAGGRLTEYDIPTANSLPVGITLGADGSVWFTEFAANQIGRMTPEGEFTEYPIPSAGSFPVGITVGGDGALYFTEHGTDQIGRITEDGQIREYPLAFNAHPFLITTAADGDVYFTESGLGRVGRLSMAGVVSTIAVGGVNSSVIDLAAGQDGVIWVTDWTTGKVGRLLIPNLRERRERRKGSDEPRYPQPRDPSNVY